MAPDYTPVPGDVANIMSISSTDFSIPRSPYTKARQIPGAYYFRQ